MGIDTTYRRLLILTVLLAGFVSCTSLVSAQTYGLKFNGQNVTLDKRTELSLSPNGFLEFEDEFEISFDYKTTRIYPNSNDGFFGYVFRIISEEDFNIDLLSAPVPKIKLNLVLGNSNTIIPVLYSQDYVNQWINLRLKFLLSEDKLMFYTPDTFYVQEGVGFQNQEAFKIIFGVNDYKHFTNSDVPSMTIKNVEIFEKGKLKYSWLLNEREGNVAEDRIKGLEAQVTNPVWLINNHANWQTQLTEEIKGSVITTVNAEGGEIFILGQDEITVYDAQKNSISKQKYVNKPLFIKKSYEAIYNSLDNKIYCYTIDIKQFYVLDLATGEWDRIGSNDEFETEYRHHNSYFNPADNCIYVFGGYGMHQYKNAIWKIDLGNETWSELPTDDEIFEPRYLSGIGALNDTVYLFGGYGSQTGNQLINPQSYFDLIGYSIKDSSLFQKFEVPRLIDDMVVGNSMWINDKTRDYYALVFSKIKFNGVLQLIRGNLDSPTIEKVGDKIPFKFLDIRSTADLYYLPDQDQLYVLTSYHVDSTTQVAIYSINNPPNAAPVDVPAEIKTSSNLGYYVAIALIVLALMVFWIIRGAKRRRSTSSEAKIADDTVKGMDDVGLKIEEVQPNPKYHLIFFGGFQVFNRDFQDITNKFSPLLKELFLLILLNSYKNNKGISSDKITEALWYDKSEKSARNNRAVNIAKLRGILEELGSCELSKKTGYWKIELKDDSVKSDYVDFLNISASKNNLTKQNVMHLMGITKKGAFLSNVHYDWLDDFKANVSDRIIDTLVVFAKSCDVKKEAEFIVRLADCIFNFDQVDEDAMVLKCRAQYWMGKHTHAKATYEKFYKEYFTMYGQEYEKAFLDILELKE